MYELCTEFYFVLSFAFVCGAVVSAWNLLSLFFNFEIEIEPLWTVR